MTRFGWMVMLTALAICIALVAGIMWLFGQKAGVDTGAQSHATTTPVTDPSQLSIYTSGEHGISFFYPSTATLVDAFSTTTGAVVPWRVHASASGTPIVQVQTAGGDVRIGVSANAKEVSGCTNAGPSEEVRGSFTVGTIIWKEFVFQKLGTDNERSVTSYRTVHAKKCYALEVFTPLGGTASSTGYTIKDTITSFSFAN